MFYRAVSLFGFSLFALGACGGTEGEETVSLSSTSSAGSGGGTSTTAGSGGSGPSTSSGGEPQSITLTFAAEVNGAPFACGQAYEGVGLASSKLDVLDLRMYVHDFRLVDGATEIPLTLEQDGTWQVEGLALLDFENKQGKCANGTAQTNVTVRGTVPAGTAYDGIRFRLGVPFEQNHADASTAPSPLNLSALFWSWQGGHKFLRADLLRDGTSNGFAVHLGSTGCTGNPSSGEMVSCSNPNVGGVELSNFDASSDTIVFDLGAVVAATDFTKPDGGGATGCLAGKSDPECGPILERLGVDLATGAPKPATQVAFKVK